MMIMAFTLLYYNKESHKIAKPHVTIIHIQNLHLYTHVCCAYSVANSVCKKIIDLVTINAKNMLDLIKINAKKLLEIILKIL